MDIIHVSILTATYCLVWMTLRSSFTKSTNNCSTACVTGKSYQVVTPGKNILKTLCLPQKNVWVENTIRNVYPLSNNFGGKNRMVKSYLPLESTGVRIP